MCWHCITPCQCLAFFRVQSFRPTLLPLHRPAARGHHSSLHTRILQPAAPDCSLLPRHTGSPPFTIDKAHPVALFAGLPRNNIYAPPPSSFLCPATSSRPLEVDTETTSSKLITQTNALPTIAPIQSTRRGTTHHNHYETKRSSSPGNEAQARFPCKADARPGYVLCPTSPSLPPLDP